MARKDQGTSRADKPAPRPPVSLPRDRTYSVSDFEVEDRKARTYRLKGTDTVVSKRQRDTAIKNFLSNEFRASRHRPTPEGQHYMGLLRAYTETHTDKFGDPETTQARDLAERSPEWQKAWRDLIRQVGPHGEPNFLDENRHYKSLKLRTARADALKMIFGDDPSEGDRDLWDMLMSPEQPDFFTEDAA